MKPPLTALAALAGLLVGAGLSWLYCSRAAEIDARHAAERHATELAERVLRLREAQRHGDTLTRQLAAATEAAQTLKEERDDALAKLTDGRKCLSGAAVSVLNRRPGAVPVPAAAGQPAAHAAGRAAADAGQPAASDRDVVRWATDAQRRYAECAATLNALVGWHEADMQQGGMP